MGNSSSAAVATSPATAAAGDPRPIDAKVEPPSSFPSDAAGDPGPMEAKIDPPSSPPSETLDTSPPLPEQPAPLNPEGDSTEASAAEGAEPEEDEEEYECGFCIFMKAGGCKDPFVAWEDCIEEAQKTGEDAVDKCAEVTFLLKKCMDEHPDYYEPVLRAERAMADDIAAEEDEAAPEQNEAASGTS